MSTLVIDEGRFVQQWGWTRRGAVPDNLSPNDIIYSHQHFVLSELWPQQIRCGLIKRIDIPMDAAFIDIGCEADNILAMMPLKGRKLTTGQKIWLRIRRLPRDGKGAQGSFVEPAGRNEGVGNCQDLPQSNGWDAASFPIADADQVVATSALFTAPGLNRHQVMIDPSAAQAFPAVEAQSSQADSETHIEAQGVTVLFEPGRTLTAIDVNGAPTMETNLAAIPAIASAIWRFQFGGLIIIDFIKPERKAQRATVTQALAAAFQQLEADLPPQLAATPPQCEISSMDHRGLVIIERERRGGSPQERMASDGQMLMVSTLLEQALKAQRPQTGQQLFVNPVVHRWLNATAFRRSKWQDFLDIQPLDTLSQIQWRWSND